MDCNTVYNDDCFSILPQIEEKSVHLIICDPPYSQTPLEWDRPFDIQKLWYEYKRIIKPNGVILMFGQEPFSSLVRTSNLSMYKYDWYWVKERLTNVFQVKRRPGKVVETISVFYDKQPVYNPQKTKHDGKLVTNKIGDSARWSIVMAGTVAKSKPLKYYDDGTRYPTQVLNIQRKSRVAEHPTEKPYELMSYLIKTYTNEDMVVLDSFAGSGNSLLAAKDLDRQFIGIERDEHYFAGIKNKLAYVD